MQPDITDRISAANHAFRHLEQALSLVRPLDVDIYWDLAATACDAADMLGARLSADEPRSRGEPAFLGDSILAPHRTAIRSMHPGRRPLERSASASALDMVALARNLLQGSLGQ